MNLPVEMLERFSQVICKGSKEFPEREARWAQALDMLWAIDAISCEEYVRIYEKLTELVKNLRNR